MNTGVDGFKESIIRRGNHFVLLRCGWVLIDGPWYEALIGYASGGGQPFPGSFVQIPYYPMPSMRAFTDEVSPICLNELTLTWEPINIHPGYCHKFVPSYNSIHYILWRRWQTGRRRLGWRLPDGRLPAYINHVPFEEDLELHDWIIMNERKICYGKA